MREKKAWEFYKKEKYKRKNYLALWNMEKRVWELSKKEGRNGETTSSRAYVGSEGIFFGKRVLKTPARLGCSSEKSLDGTQSDL